jgi:hypothetical protein
LKAFPLYLGTERSGWTYRLKDESTWRQFGYHLFALVVGGAGAVLVAAVWAVGAVLTMAPLVGLSPFWIAAGIVLLFAAPWPARLVAAADLLTARALLGPSGKAVLSERVASVERSRVELIDAADAERRRIERDEPGHGQAVVPPRYAPTGRYARNGLARRAYVWLSPGTDRATAEAAIRTVVAGQGATLVTTAQLVASETAFSRRLVAVRQRSVAGIVVLFCFIAIVNTVLMATADRRRDLAVLRLGGATPRQVLTVFVAESLLIAGIGVVLAVGASAVDLTGLWLALRQLFGPVGLVIPCGTVAAIAVTATLLALCGTILPARLTKPRQRV